MTKGASNLRESIMLLLQAKKGEATMRSPTLKRRHKAAIRLLLVGTLFLVTACGTSLRSGSQPTRAVQAALTTGGYHSLAPIATTSATPTPTSVASPAFARSATSVGVVASVPADTGTGSPNKLVPGVILAALVLVALISLLFNRHSRRPPPDTE